MDNVIIIIIVPIVLFQEEPLEGSYWLLYIGVESMSDELMSDIDRYNRRSEWAPMSSRSSGRHSSSRIKSRIRVSEQQYWRIPLIVAERCCHRHRHSSNCYGTKSLYLGIFISFRLPSNWRTKWERKYGRRIMTHGHEELVTKYKNTDALCSDDPRHTVPHTSREQ